MKCPMCGKEYTDKDMEYNEKHLIVDDTGLANIDLPECFGSTKKEEE